MRGEGAQGALHTQQQPGGGETTCGTQHALTPEVNATHKPTKKTHYRELAFVRPFIAVVDRLRHTVSAPERVPTLNECVNTARHSEPAAQLQKTAAAEPPECRPKTRPETVIARGPRGVVASVK